MNIKIKTFILFSACFACLLLLSIWKYDILTSVEAVDIHSIDREQQTLSETSNQNQNEQFNEFHSGDSIVVELRKTKAYVDSVINEIQRLTDNGTFTLQYNLKEARKYIRNSDIDKVDVEGVISLLTRAGKKGSDIINKKIQVIIDVLKSYVSNDVEIQSFVTKSSNLFVEWSKKIGVRENIIQSQISFDQNHKLLRILFLGMSTLHAVAANNNPDKQLTLELNHLSIFSGDELTGTYCGTKASYKKSSDTLDSSSGSDDEEEEELSSTHSYPTSWNLVDQGIIGPVLNQGSCGCCYAFSAIEALQGFYASQQNDDSALYELSEQQIVDCDTTTYGCNGGSYQDVWEYINSVGGVTTSSNYPYTSTDGVSGTCHTELAEEGVINVTSSHPFKSIFTDAQLQEVVYTQPVSIAIQANT